MDSPPPIDLLRKLQLFRSMIVNFVNMPDFSDMVVGCFARVLLETRHEDSRRDADHYYIACIKGAQKGPRYTGFSAETMTTEWHIIVELPPCFRSTQNGNVVQLNSISNSPFRNTEYESWIETRMRQEGMHFPSLPQLHFRLSLLQQQKQHALSLELQRPRNGEDAEVMEQLRATVEREVLETHLKLPMIDQLRSLSMTELREIELQVSDILTRVRVLVNEQIKCFICRSRVSTEVCYPCKHQVLCKSCAEHIDHKCPVPNCNIPVSMTFEPYSS